MPGRAVAYDAGMPIDLNADVGEGFDAEGAANIPNPSSAW